MTMFHYGYSDAIAGRAYQPGLLRGQALKDYQSGYAKGVIYLKKSP